MKFLVFFFLCFVALTSAAPQLIWPGTVTTNGWGGTIVAGPRVVNGVGPFGLGGFVNPGIVGII